MPIEINGADEATVGPIREALKGAEKARALLFPGSEAAPASSELPDTAARAGRAARFDSAGLPYAEAGTIAGLRTVTAAATAGTDDGTILCDATAGAFDLALPPAADVPGRIYTVKKIDAGANAVTIAPDGSETIDGAATLALTAENQAAQVQSDGTGWRVIGGWPG